MSVKARKEAIQKEQKEIALRESKKEAKSKPGTVAMPRHEIPIEDFPTMPVRVQTHINIVTRLESLSALMTLGPLILLLLDRSISERLRLTQRPKKH